MPRYQISFARSARKELEALEAATVKRIWLEFEALGYNPRPRGCLKLKGEKRLWRVRVGEYRVVYYIYDENLSIEITSVRHRREAYR